MTLDDLLDDIKNQEINFYLNCMNDISDVFQEMLKLQSSNLSGDEFYSKMQSLTRERDSICSDYDVIDLLWLKEESGDGRVLSRIESMLSDHITKLKRSITKIVGKGETSVNEISSNVFHIEGVTGFCDVTITPIKLTSTKAVSKTRFKISNDGIKEITPEVNQIEDNVYIKEWKSKELDGLLSGNKKFWKEYRELTNIETENKSKLNDIIQRYKVDNGKAPERIKLNTFGTYEYSDESIQKVNSEYIASENNRLRYRKNNTFFYENGNRSDFEDICVKTVNKHFEELQNKVEKYIGKIINLEPMGDNGYDFKFTGEKGNCEVEVIMAGGYNIQRLHTRWIVKNVKLNECKTTNYEIKLGGVKMMNLQEALVLALQGKLEEARNPENDEINTKIRKSLNGSTKYVQDLQDAGLETELDDKGKVSMVRNPNKMKNGAYKGMNKNDLKNSHPDTDYYNYLTKEKEVPVVQDTGDFAPTNVFRNSSNFEKTIGGKDTTYRQTDANGVSKAIPKRYKTGNKNYDIDLDKFPRKNYNGVASYEPTQNQELIDFKNNKNKVDDDGYLKRELDKAKAEYDNAKKDFDKVNDKVNDVRNRIAKSKEKVNKTESVENKFSNVISSIHTEDSLADGLGIIIAEVCEEDINKSELSVEEITKRVEEEAKRLCVDDEILQFIYDHINISL